MDIQKEPIFFSKQGLKLVDRSILNKPLIDTLYKVAIDEALQQGNFDLLDYQKMVRNL